MRYFNTAAFILKKFNRGENDYFLTLFSADHGHLQALAKNCRQITSKKGRHLDLINLTNFQLYRLGDHLIVTECQSLNTFLPLKSNYQKSLYAQSIIEIFTKTLSATPDIDENRSLFSLLSQSLHLIETCVSSLHLDFFHEQFKIKLLQINGSLPQTERCHQSDTPWQPGDQIQLNQEGHLIKTTNPTDSTINFETLKLINYISHHHLLGQNFQIPAGSIKQLQSFTRLFYEYYLHLQFKSEQLLHA